MKKLLWILIMVPGMALADHDDGTYVDIDLDVDAEVELEIDNDSDADAEANVSIEGDEVVYDFPSNSAYAPHGLSHISCDQLLGAGYTNVNGSGSIGIPIPRWMSGKIKDCESNADATWLAEMGLTQAAVEARCSTRSMRARFGGDGSGKDEQVDACVRTIGNMVEATRSSAPGSGETSAALQQEQQQQRNEVALLRAQLTSLEGMEGYDDAELRRRLAVLEIAAHMPGSSLPVVHQD